MYFNKFGTKRHQNHQFLLKHILQCFMKRSMHACSSPTSHY